MRRPHRWALGAALAMTVGGLGVIGWTGWRALSATAPAIAPTPAAPAASQARSGLPGAPASVAAATARAASSAPDATPPLAKLQQALAGMCLNERRPVPDPASTQALKTNADPSAAVQQAARAQLLAALQRGTARERLLALAIEGSLLSSGAPPSEACTAPPQACAEAAERRVQAPQAAMRQLALASKDRFMHDMALLQACDRHAVDAEVGAQCAALRERALAGPGAEEGWRWAVALQVATSAQDEAGQERAWQNMAAAPRWGMLPRWTETLLGSAAYAELGAPQRWWAILAIQPLASLWPDARPVVQVCRHPTQGVQRQRCEVLAQQWAADQHDVLWPRLSLHLGPALGWTEQRMATLRNELERWHQQTSRATLEAFLQPCEALPAHEAWLLESARRGSRVVMPPGAAAASQPGR